MTSQPAVHELKILLDTILTRLDNLESAAGITPSNAVGRSVDTPDSSNMDNPSFPAVDAYDEYLQKSVKPLINACNELGEVRAIGESLQQAWDGVRTIVLLASQSKCPQGDITTELQPYLKPIQTSLEAIRKLRLDRKFDWHHKAVMELMTCFSWILIKPPQQTPAAFCKEAIASSDFWSNRIRKEYKGKDEKHIAFCDSLKTAGQDLVSYIMEFHKTGLSFNVKGGTLADAASITEKVKTDSDKVAVSSKNINVAVSENSGGGLSGIMAELQKKQTSDGSSAATGLRKVTKEQQTWRKEFQASKSSNVENDGRKGDAIPTRKVNVVQQKKSQPKFEYQERGSKWVVENQTKDSSNGSMTIDISDPKQQVYIYNCEDLTILLKGEKKVKSIVIDTCQRVNLVFDTCISSCEIVNSKKVQCQTLGVCPTFSIDKTIGCVIFLSEESIPISSFITAQSSEMNVSYPDGVEQKEIPIPEQFVHKMNGGNLVSQVSDLYH
jgi:adenylyl cyclase-associated protein